MIYKKKAFKDKLSETNTALVVADWSNPDPRIDDILARHNQAVLPFALIYPATDPENPITLRDFYTLEATLKALDQANKPR